MMHIVNVPKAVLETLMHGLPVDVYDVGCVTEGVEKVERPVLRFPVQLFISH